MYIYIRITVYFQFNLYNIRKFYCNLFQFNCLVQFLYLEKKFLCCAFLYHSLSNGKSLNVK